MEVRRSKIAEFIEYEWKGVYILNIVIAKTRKDWQRKTEKYNMVFTCYNDKARSVKEEYKAGDTVNITFGITSKIQPRRIQTILKVHRIEKWQTKADKMEESIKQKTEDKQIVSDTFASIDQAVVGFENQASE